MNVKRYIAAGLLAEHGSFHVTALTDRPDVLLPAIEKDTVTLNFSPRFGSGDLRIDEHGIRQTLSFKGRKFEVFLAWEAIGGMGPGPSAPESRMFFLPPEAPNVEDEPKPRGLRVVQ